MVSAIFTGTCERCHQTTWDLKLRSTINRGQSYLCDRCFDLPSRARVSFVSELIVLGFWLYDWLTLGDGGYLAWWAAAHAYERRERRLGSTLYAR